MSGFPEYERKGNASIFMFAEPLSGYRQTTARPHRTKVDWAHEVAQLLDTRYAKTPRITLVCDNLNTHTKGAFYEAFSPEKAREYVRDGDEFRLHSEVSVAKLIDVKSAIPEQDR